MTVNSDLFDAAKKLLDEGDVEGLRTMLAKSPDLATMRAPDNATLLIHLIDHPGGRPRGDETARALLQAGAEVDARQDGNTIIVSAALVL